jgi:hypothetical protein
MKFYWLFIDSDFQGFDFAEDADGKGERLLKKNYWSMMDNYFGKPFPPDFSGFEMVPDPLYKSKRKTIDIDLVLQSIMVLSDKAVGVLQDIFEKNGQYIPLINCPKKGYRAYHVTHLVREPAAIVWEKSNYRIMESNGGKLLYRPAFKESVVLNEDLFMLPDSVTDIYCSDRFKSRYEENGLKGLTFIELVVE